MLPISIIEDNIPEIQEKFELVISGLSNHPQVVIPLNEDHTVVYIVDNDGKFFLVTHLKRANDCSLLSSCNCWLC